MLGSSIPAIFAVGISRYALGFMRLLSFSTINRCELLYLRQSGSLFRSFAQHWASDHSEFGRGAIRHVTGAWDKLADGAWGGEVWARSEPAPSIANNAMTSTGVKPVLSVTRRRVHFAAGREAAAICCRREHSGRRLALFTMR
jgi:hypothetical protein